MATLELLAFCGCIALGAVGVRNASRLRNPNGVRQIATPGGWIWIWTLAAPFVIYGMGYQGLGPLLAGLIIGWIACAALGRMLHLAGIIRL